MTQPLLFTRLTPLLMGFMAFFILMVQGCFHSSGSDGGSPDPVVPVDRWTWMSGSNTIAQAGIYGTKGDADAANMPGARFSVMSKADASGTLWLFGGEGQDHDGENGYGLLNDLWHWDGSRWTWVSGSNGVRERGHYGTKGVADAANVPGARRSGVTWVDASNNFWLFGGLGYGYDSSGARKVGYFNDLWRWDGSHWTWISGSEFVLELGIYGEPGIYGEKGTPRDINIPGARTNAASWVDANGDFWLFGGSGYDGDGSLGWLNDLWRWDGTRWTWMSGSDVGRQPGVYGTKNIAENINVPGGRINSVTWVGTDGDFWLWGGRGIDRDEESAVLNDLWRWDGSDWTWISGSNTVKQSGNYGTKGTADVTNIPGARYASVSWIDASGNFWLFGGWGYDSVGEEEEHLNDLWRWDGNNWTWVSGSNVIDQEGIYGTEGIADVTNVPGARYRLTSWTDTAGNLWIFGGDGATAGDSGHLNDMWRYQP